MKAALVLLLTMGIGSTVNAPHDSAPAAAVAAVKADMAMAVEAGWTASVKRSDPGTLQVNVSERKGSMLGTTLKLADVEGLTTADLTSSRPVTFRLRREAGTVTFTGRFDKGIGEGTLRYDIDQSYWSKLAGMGIRNDWSQSRYQLLALPLLDLQSAYVAALRRGGASGDLSDYVGMRAVGVHPEMVREVRPLIAGNLEPHDLMSFAALGVTPDYVREMRGAFARLEPSELSSMKALNVRPADINRYKAIGLAVSPQDASGLKALGVTPDYVATMRAAGARIHTAGDAQSFRALGLSPAAVKRAVGRGRPNPSASDVMDANNRY